MATTAESLTKAGTSAKTNSRPTSRRRGDRTGFRLPQCDGKRVALVLTLGEGKNRVFRGVGRWLKDDLLGDALRVQLDGDDKSELLIADAQWRGEIAPDTNYGCELCLSLS